MNSKLATRPLPDPAASFVADVTGRAPGEGAPGCRGVVVDVPPVADAACRHLPVIVRSEHDSVLDALLALDLPRGEVMDLVVATWGRPAGAILATVDGGRPVAAVPLADGRWVAGNAYPEHASASAPEAGRQLARLLRRGRRGLLACIDAD